MGDSSSDEESYSRTATNNYILFRDRPEWRDVQPVSQDDGPAPVAAIAYSDKFKDCFDYFRAIIQSQEKSERTLELTKIASELNPANYTVWQYRRLILRHLEKDLQEELEQIQKTILRHPKNYQVWHHCRLIIEWKQDPSQELKFTEKILALDSKNYHAWQHRQWVIETFKLYDEELEFTSSLLMDDVRNNSAWNQRYFIIKLSTGFTPEVIEKEVKFACEMIKVATNNESAWNYLRGILRHADPGEISRVLEFCRGLKTAGNTSPYLLGFMVELLRADHNADKSEIQKILHSLSTELDPIRAQYWNYIARDVAAN